MRIDLTGKKFNRLNVLSFSHRDNGGRAIWSCQCNCGKLSKVEGYNLKSGTVKSCGCLHSEITTRRNLVHGDSFRGKWSKLYSKFVGIKRRCNNPHEKCYKNYGGRGIKLLWESFEKFRDDMTESYNYHVSLFGAKNTTIDRIDVNGNYCKENCRWATWKEQRNNQRI